MIILLLVFTQVGCEWVEISQNHYRKEPLHKIHLPNVEHTTKYNRIYINNSITEKQWHRGVIDKVSNVGNIRRVQHPSVKTSSYRRKQEDNRFNENFNDHTDITLADYKFVSDKPNIQKFANEQDDELENLNKVTEQTILTTATDINHVKNPNSKIIQKIPTLTNDYDRRFGEKIKEDDVNGRRLINKPLKGLEELDFNENDQLYPITKPNFYKTSLEDELKIGLAKNSEKRYSNTKESTKIRLIHSNDYNGDVHKKQKTNEEYLEATNYKFHETSTHPLEDYFNVRNKVMNVPDYRDKSDYDDKISKDTTLNGANDDKLNDFNEMKNTPSLDDEEKFPKIEDFVSKDVNVTKENPVKGMWKLIKLVTDTIYKNTHRSFKSKINYLESLKATILASIEDEIDRAWPDDAQRHGSRRSRSAQAQSRGHVEFPSSESTLMTISFLTFAVFVIKLVLQVIHTYKNKTMMVTPTIVAAVGRAAAAIRNTAQNT